MTDEPMNLTDEVDWAETILRRVSMDRDASDALAYMLATISTLRTQLATVTRERDEGAVPRGEWTAGLDCGRPYVESDCVRLDIRSDFATPEHAMDYAEGIAGRLNDR